MIPIHFRLSLTARPAQGHRREGTPLLLFAFSLHFRGWMADAPTMFPAAHNAGERFRYPVQTKRRRRWHQARTLPVRELLRFVSTAPHSLSTGERCAQGVSARATPVVRSFPETFVAKAQLPCSGSFHTRTSAWIRNHRVQVSQTLLAEPYKYSNSRDTSSMAVCCIRWGMVDFRATGCAAFGN